MTACRRREEPVAESGAVVDGIGEPACRRREEPVAESRAAETGRDAAASAASEEACESRG